MNKVTKAKAIESAGFREKYAITHGKENWFVSDGKNYIEFTYSSDDPYQDANGAIYCVTEGRWVN